MLLGRLETTMVAPDKALPGRYRLPFPRIGDEQDVPVPDEARLIGDRQALPGA